MMQRQDAKSCSHFNYATGVMVLFFINLVLSSTSGDPSI